MSILQVAKRRVAEDPQLRLGQCVWNVAVERYPEIISYSGSDIDPFYDDDKIPAFLAVVGDF